MMFTPLSPFLGVDAVDVPAAEHDAATFDALKGALTQHKLVRLRDQRLGPADFLAFARAFGPLQSLRRAGQSALHFAEFPEIKIVSNEHTAGGEKVGDGDAAENGWHTDGSYLAAPTTLTFLYGRVAPANPPRTVFLCLQEAYRTLPPRLERQLRGRQAIHYSTYNHDAAHAEAVNALGDPSRRKHIGYWRPLVIADPASGEPSLLPPRQRDCVIEGLSEAASRALADEIWDHIESQTCKWGEAILPGDLIVWDNRYSLHMRESFADNDHRLLWHTTTSGEPYCPWPLQAGHRENIQ